MELENYFITEKIAKLFPIWNKWRNLRIIVFISYFLSLFISGNFLLFTCEMVKKKSEAIDCGIIYWHLINFVKCFEILIFSISSRRQLTN